MTIRCKLQLESVIPKIYGGSQATFRCAYDQKICEEDSGFQKATPSGLVYLEIDNPKALAQLTLGAFYYFDMIPIEVT
jgi:hypothetical protein